MNAGCEADRMLFPLEAEEGPPKMETDFSGGAISSNAGAQLPGLAAKGMQLFERIAACFVDRRAQEKVVFPVETLVGQRILGLALGYADLNDHDELRRDPVVGSCLDRLDPRRADCEPLAGESTLNRLELAADGGVASKHRKVMADFTPLDDLLVDLFLEERAEAPERIVIDIDRTDAELHGEQEMRFFSGYYREYCYMPLVAYVDKTPVMVRLRTSGEDGAADLEKDLARMVGRIRARWPRTEIVLRTDSAFRRDPILTWCEDNGVHYVIGLPRNARLERRIEAAMKRSRVRAWREMAKPKEEREPSRRFRSFQYRTRSSWSRARRVIAKVEAPPGGEPNARFIVTSLPASSDPAQESYEEFYCARGDAENRVKEHKNHLFMDRCSSNLMNANALRLYFSTFAFVLMRRLRASLANTALEKADFATLRLRLLKIGAVRRRSTRRIHIAMSSACPDQETFRLAWSRLAPA